MKLRTDKKDKEATPVLAVHSGTDAAGRHSWDMTKFLFYLFFTLNAFSAAYEYKLCATVEQETLCKWIEASGNGQMTCTRVSDSVDCLLKMQRNEADLGTFFPEEALLASRFLGNSAVVLAEVRHPDRADNAFAFETVAVVGSDFFGGLSALKGSAYCHPGFQKAQYWSDRVLKDFEKKVLDHFEDDLKCNAVARSAYEDDLYRLDKIFSKACRPGIWAVGDWWDKKLKREYRRLCQQCEYPATCSYEVRNKGRHSDALRCLTLRGGNVTYTALEFVRDYFQLDSEDGIFNPGNKNRSRYSFLCRDGSTRPLTSSNSCSWIKQPWTAVVALNSSALELSKKLTEWLGNESNDFKPSKWNDHLRNALTKGDGVLKFCDAPVTLADYIEKGRNNPYAEKESCRAPIRWCTIGAGENKKCEFVAAAALIHGLPIRIRCVQGTAKIHCLDKIRKREADVVFVDSDLGYISRKFYNLTTAAHLETQKVGNYYGVAVVKGNSAHTLKSLRGKKACFPRYNGLGWITFVRALKSSSLVPETSCPDSKRVLNYFSKVCAPGAKEWTRNVHVDKAPKNLCDGCPDPNNDCKASAGNPYYGELGALRCLKDGAGDVAFLNFYTIQKYLRGDRQKLEDLDINIEDIKILCKDGYVETFNLTNPEKCSFTQLSGGEVVMRKDLEQVEKSDIFLTLAELDDLFGTTSRHYRPALRIFEPFDGETDVLFKDSAVSLTGVFETSNTFVKNYVQLLNGLDNCWPDSGSSIILPSTFVLAFHILLNFFN